MSTQLKLVPWKTPNLGTGTVDRRLDVDDANEEGATLATLGFEVDEDRQEVILVIDEGTISETVKTWGAGGDADGPEYVLITKEGLAAFQRATTELGTYKAREQSAPVEPPREPWYVGEAQRIAEGVIAGNEITSNRLRDAGLLHEVRALITAAARIALLTTQKGL